MHEDNSSIEEQIARSYYQTIHRSQRADFRPWSSIGAEARAPWLTMARETLRIATFNARQAFKGQWTEPQLPAADWTDQA